MNIVAFVHLVAGLIAIALSLPLVRGKVRMNHWYGIRIPAAFESDERWFAMNRYGGSLVIRWGAVLALMGACGAALDRKWWVLYNVLALVPLVGGLILVVVLTYRHARTA